jgi:hypothetical protein
VIFSKLSGHPGVQNEFIFDNRVGNQERIFLYSHHGENHAKLASFKNAKNNFCSLNPLA